MPLTESARKNIVIWLIRLLIAAAVLVAVSLELLHILPVLGILLGGISLAAIAVGGCWYMPNYFRRYRVELTDGVLQMERGVMRRTALRIPLEKALTVSVVATPLMRLMNLQVLIVGLPGRREMVHCADPELTARIVAACGGESDR